MSVPESAVVKLKVLPSRLMHLRFVAGSVQQQNAS